MPHLPVTTSGISVRCCHTITLFNTLSGRSRGKLTVEEQTGGQSEAHIDILPCNSFQHSARHTLFISRCSDLIRGGCTPLSRCHRMRRALSATPPINHVWMSTEWQRVFLHFLQSALVV